MKYNEELHERLVDLHNHASPFPWIFSSTQYPSGEYYTRVVDANMRTVIDEDCVEYLQDYMLENDFEVLMEYIKSMSVILEEIKRLREDNSRVRELESRLEQHEYATDWLGHTYPEIYEEWLEEYRK